MATKQRLTEEYKAIEDHATGVAGEEDADCPVEHCKLWSADGVCGDVCRHGWGREGGSCRCEGGPVGRVCVDDWG